jgi:hypothetical protein
LWRTIPQEISRSARRQTIKEPSAPGGIRRRRTTRGLNSVALSSRAVVGHPRVFSAANFEDRETVELFRISSICLLVFFFDGSKLAVSGRQKRSAEDVREGRFNRKGPNQHRKVVVPKFTTPARSTLERSFQTPSSEASLPGRTGSDNAPAFEVDVWALQQIESEVMTRLELKTIALHHRSWLKAEREGLLGDLRGAHLRGDFCAIMRNLGRPGYSARTPSLGPPSSKGR